MAVLVQILLGLVSRCYEIKTSHYLLFYTCAAADYTRKHKTMLLRYNTQQVYINTVNRIMLKIYITLVAKCGQYSVL